MADAVDLSPGFFFFYFFGVGKRAGLLWDDLTGGLLEGGGDKKIRETLPKVIRIGVLWVFLD